MSGKDDFGGCALGGLGCVAMLAYVSVAFAAAFALLEGYWGWHWFWAVLVLWLALSFAPPAVAIACFFGAWIEWDWPFLGALALAAPGVVLGVAAIFLGGVLALLERLRAPRPR